MGDIPSTHIHTSILTSDRLQVDGVNISEDNAGVIPRDF